MYKLTESNLILRLSDNACIPADPANTDYAEYLKWLSEGNIPLPVDPPSQEQIKQSLINAIQSYLDKEAQAHFYDGILSLCSYATSINTKFGPEGQAGVIWRDACWSVGYAVLADCEAGTRTIPTVEELMAEMPVMVWP
jgi:hypothetical protein